VTNFGPKSGATAHPTAKRCVLSVFRRPFGASKISGRSTAEMSGWGDLSCLCSRSSDKQSGRGSEKGQPLRRGTPPHSVMDPRTVMAGRGKMVLTESTTTVRDSQRSGTSLVPSIESDIHPQTYYANGAFSPSSSSSSNPQTFSELESLPTQRKNIYSKEALYPISLDTRLANKLMTIGKADESTIRFSV
jgi:hypothetical protein